MYLIDASKVTKSYIWAANVLDQVVVLIEYCDENSGDESSTICLKHGRPFGSKDNIKIIFCRIEKQKVRILLLWMIKL